MPVSNANDVRRIIRDRMIHFLRLDRDLFGFPGVVGSAIPLMKGNFRVKLHIVERKYWAVQYSFKRFYNGVYNSLSEILF